MSDFRCVICQRVDPADGWTCCQHCADRLADDLARLPVITRLAATWTTDKVVTGEATSGAEPTQVPLRLDVLGAQTADEALAVIESWERLVREHLRLAAYGTVWPARAARSRHTGTPLHLVTLDAATAFLRAQLALLVEAFDFPIEDMASEVGTLRRALDNLEPDKRCDDHATEDNPTKPCGKCDALNGRGGMRIPCQEPHPDNDGRTCGWRIVVSTTHPSEDLECRRCGHVTTSGRLILVALNDPAVVVWAYPDVIEATLGIPTRRLRKWAVAGTIARQGSRYDVGAAYRQRVG